VSIVAQIIPELSLPAYINDITLISLLGRAMMTKAPQTRRHKAGAQTSRRDCPATVASRGVRARLVPVDPGREQAVADLLARYERVCREWDRLVRQAVDLLGPEFPSRRSGEESSPLQGEE
jgi:hypothetical protein